MKTLAQLRWGVRKNLRETGQFASAALAGTVTIVATLDLPGQTVTGTGTVFTQAYQVGDEICVSNICRSIVQITSDTVLLVASPFGVAAAGAAHYLVQRQGGWTDDDINDELNAHRAHLQDMIWRDAKQALYAGPITVDAAMGVGGDIVTIPVGLLSFDAVEYRQTSGEAYVPLGRYDITQKDSSSVAPWLYPIAGAGGVQKPTARPTFYTVIAPTTIELNTYPSVATVQGLRLYGAQRFADLIYETDTLGLPEVESWEHVVELMTTAHLLKKEKAEADRAQLFERDAAEAYQKTIAPWYAGGRDSGPASVVLLD